MQWKVYPADLLSIALDKREIAAISGSEPFSFRLLQSGKYQLIASNMSGDYANLSCCVLGVSGALARDHKPVAAALTRRFSRRTAMHRPTLKAWRNRSWPMH